MKPIEKRDLARRLCTVLKMLHNETCVWNLEHPLVQDYLTRMTDPSRSHHTLELVRERLDLLGNLRSRIKKDWHLEFAVFMINAVNEPGSQFNAKRSGEYAAQFLGSKNALLVAELISMSDDALDHSESFGDARYAHDIVYTVYGREQPEFESYLRRIAIEQRSHVPVDQFVADSVIKYRSMLEKAESERLYLTPYFQFKCGKCSVENLRYALHSFGQKVA